MGEVHRESADNNDTNTNSLINFVVCYAFGRITSDVLNQFNEDGEEVPCCLLVDVDLSEFFFEVFAVVKESLFTSVLKKTLLKCSWQPTDN